MESPLEAIGKRALSPLSKKEDMKPRQIRLSKQLSRINDKVSQTQATNDDHRTNW